MDALLQVLGAIVVGALTSTGFWAFLQHKDKSKSATSRLLMGLAYDKLLDRGETYIIRGWVTMDELEEIQKYLYAPYKDLGGNGMADRVMNEISRLPLKSYRPYAETVRSQAETKEIPRVSDYSQPRSQHRARHAHVE